MQAWSKWARTCIVCTDWTAVVTSWNDALTRRGNERHQTPTQRLQRADCRPPPTTDAPDPPSRQPVHQTIKKLYTKLPVIAVTTPTRAGLRRCRRPRPRHAARLATLAARSYWRHTGNLLLRPSMGISHGMPQYWYSGTIHSFELTFNLHPAIWLIDYRISPRRAVVNTVMTRRRADNEGQRSVVQKIERKRTDRRTDGRSDMHDFPANAVGNQSLDWSTSLSE